MVSRAIDHLVSAVTIILAAYALWIVADRSGLIANSPDSTPSPARRPGYTRGDSLPIVPGIDYSASPRTLLVVVRSDCRFCLASIPFYKRIVDDRVAHKSNLRIIVAAPQGDTGLQSFLDDNGLAVDQIAFFRAGTLRVRGTPTLVLVDGTGRIEQLWEGQVPESEEKAVLGTLFGTSPS